MRLCSPSSLCPLSPFFTAFSYPVTRFTYVKRKSRDFVKLEFAAITLQVLCFVHWSEYHNFPVRILFCKCILCCGVILNHCYNYINSIEHKYSRETSTNGLVAKKFKIKYLCPFSPEKERNFEDISWTANKLQDNRKKRKWIPMCAIGRRGEDTQAQKRSIGFPFKTNELNRSITIEHNE